MVIKNCYISVGDDGHLYAGGKRIRIFGTNLSSFPPVEEAEYWAKTIAAQGYNCVRFHHTDSYWAECFFMHDKAWKTATFDESSFERFDKFFYELKKAGVYSNINLLTGRTIRPSVENKLPQELNKVADWKDQHCYGFWNEVARDDQRNYADKILNHKNRLLRSSMLSGQTFLPKKAGILKSSIRPLISGNRLEKILLQENQHWSSTTEQRQH